MVQRFAVLVSPPGFLDELLRVGVVPEANISLGALAGDNNIITFVLAAQLVVVLRDIIRGRMDLDRHVARAVEGVVVVEADREIAAEGFDNLRAEQLWPDRLNKAVEGELELASVGVGHDRDLHWDQVENPGAVFHLLRQVAQMLDVEAAPDTLEVDRTAAQRVGDHDGEQLLQDRKGDQLHALRIVPGQVIVDLAVTDQLAAQGGSYFEIDIIGPAQHRADLVEALPAQVVAGAAAVVEHGPLLGDIDKKPQVEQWAQLVAQGALAIDQGKACAGGRELFELIGQRRHFAAVQQAVKSLVVERAEEQDRIHIPIFRQVRLQLLVEHVFIQVERFSCRQPDGNAASLAGQGDRTGQLVQRCAHISVNTQEAGFLPDQLIGHTGCNGLG